MSFLPPPSNLAMESSCYSPGPKGLRKLHQGRLRVLTNLNKTMATTTISQIFHNPYDKSLEGFFYTFPLKDGMKIHKVYFDVGGLALYERPNSVIAFHDGKSRVYTLLRGLIQPYEKVMVHITVKEKVEYRPLLGFESYQWTLPKTMAPPHGSLIMAYEISIQLQVDLGETFKIYGFSSSHSIVTSHGGWIRVVQPKHVDHKLLASFLDGGRQLEKDVVFVVFGKPVPQTLFQSTSPPLISNGKIISEDSDCSQPRPSTEANSHRGPNPSEKDNHPSTCKQHSHSHSAAHEQNLPSASESSRTRARAPSPEPSYSSTLVCNILRLLAIQYPGDCLDGANTCFWTLHPDLPEILSISIPTLCIHCVHSNPLESRIWVTILVIAWFEMKAQDEVELWLECVQRARRWLQGWRDTGLLIVGGWEKEATGIFYESDEDSMECEDDGGYEEEGAWAEYNLAEPVHLGIWRPTDLISRDHGMVDSEIIERF